MAGGSCGRVGHRLGKHSRSKSTTSRFGDSGNYDVSRICVWATSTRSPRSRISNAAVGRSAPLKSVLAERFAYYSDPERQHRERARAHGSRYRSHVGKSVFTAALCRIFSQDGHRVAPFKSQNMSLNSAATGRTGDRTRTSVAGRGGGRRAERRHESCSDQTHGRPVVAGRFA